MTSFFEGQTPPKQGFFPTKTKVISGFQVLTNCLVLLVKAGLLKRSPKFFGTPASAQCRHLDGLSGYVGGKSRGHLK